MVLQEKQMYYLFFKHLQEDSSCLEVTDLLEKL